MTKSKPSKRHLKTEHTCAYCSQEYKTERGLAGHKCKIKDRVLQKDSKASRLAYAAFSAFHELHYRRPTTFEKFAHSTLYNAFLKFGNHIITIDAIDPQSYIDYMIRSGVAIDRWCREDEYEKYVQHLIMKETPFRGTERTLLLMQEWANSNETDLTNFFHGIAAPLAVMWIKSGRISPWVLLNCNGGKSLLSRLSDEQMTLVGPSLNIRLWNGKFQRHSKEVGEIQETLKEYGI